MGEITEKARRNPALIIAGGHTDLHFVSKIRKEYDKNYLAAVDAGLETCAAIHAVPDLIAGDFDTVDPDILAKYTQSEKLQIIRYDPVKNASDLELVVNKLIEDRFQEAIVLGALGGRSDHMLSNIRLTYFSRMKGMKLILLDETNRITCALSGPVEITKKEQWGKYVSLFPIGGTVRKITLQGFLYPLHRYVLTDKKTPSFCVSNEIAEEKAGIFFETVNHSGLIVMETSDA